MIHVVQVSGSVGQLHIMYGVLQLRTSRVVIIKFRNKTGITRVDSTGVREVGTPPVYHALSQPLIIAISVSLDHWHLNASVLNDV